MDKLEVEARSTSREVKFMSEIVKNTKSNYIRDEGFMLVEFFKKAAF